MTLADIAREAGLAPSTLVERFGSKRALLLAAGRAAASTVDLAFDAAEDIETSPLAALGEGLVLLSSGLRTRAALARQVGVLQVDIADPDFRRLAAGHAMVLRGRISLLLGRAVGEGALRESTDVARLARTVQIVYGGALIGWGIDGRGALADALRDALEAVVGPWAIPS